MVEVSIPKNKQGTKMKDYQDFIGNKRRVRDASGFETDDLNNNLFDFQRVCVQRAVKRGKFALFEDCGLGKTIQQGAWADAVVKETCGHVLILAPLCVADQSITELAKFGITVGVYGSGASIEIVNYEQLHNVDPSRFVGVVLDESSILKSCDGKTRTRLIEMFSKHQYRLCCTATPAPNDITELGNHSEFLGVMTRAEMLSTFFVNRGQGNRSWDLKGHCHGAFYEWLASWSIFVSKPSDIGFEDKGFDLPAISFEGHFVDVSIKTEGNLFFMGLGGVSERSKVRKDTIKGRVDKAAKLAESARGQVIVWCGLNAEQDMVKKALGKDAISVSGSDKPEQKRIKINQFLSGEVRFLVTKPKIVGFGMNFQNASTQVFVGLGDSYEKYYQAIRRSYRFGQTEEVQVHIVLSNVEREILDNVKRKEREALATQKKMAGKISKYQLGGDQVKEDASIEYKEGDGWRIYHGDCIEVMRSMNEDSVDFSIFSPPFSSLYTYSASSRDFGNCSGSDQFFEHFKYFVPEIKRIVKPGRLIGIHCQQIATLKSRDGYIGLQDFRGDIIRSFQEGGLIYFGEVCIDKCPQLQAIRTHSKCLLFVQNEKDSSWSRPALSDYIILMKVPGENKEPIKNDLSREDWIEFARPVWYGIKESDTLSTREAREEKDEKHICPLQLGTIDRCIRLWSNKGDTVFSPFTGIGSEGYQSILKGRKFIGAELKPSYFKTACVNLGKALSRTKELTLFQGDH